MSITGVANALTDLKAMEAATQIQYAVVAQVNEVARQLGEAVLALLRREVLPGSEVGNGNPRKPRRPRRERSRLWKC